MTRTFILVAAVLILPRLAGAEALTPEAAASAAMESARRGDWVAFEGWMHPDALTKSKQLFRPLVAEDETGQVGRIFFGVSSVKQFDSMSDSAAFVALMANIAKLPGFGDAIKNSVFRYVGSVHEGELVHIVHRADTRAMDLAVSQVSVMSLRKQ
jgi:hypothetical protein